MKKIIVLAILLVALSGCSAEQVFETVSDVQLAPVMAQVRQLQLDIPEDAAIYTLSADADNRVYLCDGYTVAVQTLPSGDLEGTLRTISGFSGDALTVIETRQGDTYRYDFVWCAASEAGDQICRAVLLDDGQYHYAVTVMTDSDMAGALQGQWQALMESVSID